MSCPTARLHADRLSATREYSAGLLRLLQKLQVGDGTVENAAATAAAFAIATATTLATAAAATA